MKRKIFYTIKNIIIVTILIVMYFFIGIKIENNKAFAATTPTSISIYNFGKKTYSTLTNGNHASVSMINDKYIFTSTGADDTARQSSSRNFCVHWTSVYNYWDKVIDEGEFVLSKIIDIRNTNGDYRVATNISNGKTYTSKLNNILAYISYYGTVDSTGYESDGVYDSGSDTLWGFRHLYAFTGWRQGVYDNLRIKTYRNSSSYNPDSDNPNGVYKDGETYANFIETNITNSSEKMKKVTLTNNPTIDSTYIGPFKVKFPTGGTGTGKEHIDNKVWCTYIDDSDSETTYSGNFYSKSGGSYTSLGNAVPRNQKFYIKVSGVDVKKVRFYNSFYLYLARVFLFDGGYSQTNISVTGKQHLKETHVEYIIESNPNINISKQVSFQPQTGYTSSIEVERGDTVYFKIAITNSGASTNINLADTLQSGLSVKAVSLTGASGSWTTTSSWSGLTNLTVNKDSTIVRYLKCKVANNASGTISNTITVTPVSGYKLDASATPSKTASASVTVLGYSYSLTKTVNKSLVEPGDIINYTITLTNNNDTKLHDMVIEDTIPAGLEYIAGTAAPDCTNWDIDDSSTTLKFTRKSVGMGKGSCIFTIQCKVSDSLVYRTSTSPITNTAKLTHIENKHDIALDTKEKSVDINLVTYDYTIDKVVNRIIDKNNNSRSDKTKAEPGDKIEYKITVNNTGTGDIYVGLTDSIVDDLLLDLSPTDSDTKVYTNEKVEAGKIKEFIITTVPISKITNAKYTVTNRVSLDSSVNINGVDVMKTTGNEDSIDVTVLGYDATLNKYITNHKRIINGTETNMPLADRSGLTNEEKNDGPVIMKKGDTFTYTIVLENVGTNATTGNTTLYNPQIVDGLPEGIEEVKEVGYTQPYLSSWTKSGNTYTYNGNVGIGTSVTLEIDCKVTMSNMYLLNIENTATFGNINNRNNINTASVLNQEKNKEYVRLDELLIAGNVWKDDNRDGLNNSENGIEKVLVYLRDAINDSIVKETTTDANGNYKFEQVIKGTNKDATTGNYDKTTSEYRQYYVEFVYDGIDYRSTTYTGANTKAEKGQGHLTGNGKYEADYVVDSNAIEKYADRALINNALELISYNEANGTKGSIALEYEKNDNNSTVKKDVLKNNLKAKLGSELKNIDSSDLAANNIVVNISSYSFMDESGNRDNLWLYTNITSTATEGYVPETDYLQHINLGLTTRDGFDLSLTNKVEEIETVVNGQSMKYSFSDPNINDINQFVLYNADYAYRHDRHDIAYADAETNLSEDAYNRMQEIVSSLKQGEQSELNIFVKFKTTVTNNSTYAYARVNEIAQFYDENFKDHLETVQIGFDDDKNGTIDRTETRRTTAEDSSGHTITISGTPRVDVDYNENATLNGLKVLYINTDDILAPGESKDIYITYIVDKDSTTRNLKINDGIGADGRLQYISIIGQYSSYDDASGSKISGLIDDNSNPGNLGLRNTSESPTKDVKDTEDATKKYSGQNYSEKYFENDTHISGVKFELNYSRKIKGLTWRDARTDSIDGQLAGNGRYIETDGDVVIGGITVQLVEIINNGNDYYEIIRQQTTSDSAGEYTIDDFMPGRYIVRFRYGGSNSNLSLEYNGQDYKSTTYTLPADPIANYEDLTQNDRVSDARDDELRRLEVMNYSLEMYNEKAEILKGTETSDAEILKRETKMFADTVQFFSEYELLRVVSGAMEDKESIINMLNGNWNIVEGGIEYTRNIDYEIKNIDFGIQERPTSTIDLDKYIKQIKLETSAGDVLVDLYYDEHGNLRTDIESKGTENVQAINNTPTQQGFRYINMDEEILQGAKITIIYGFKVTNLSEVDHVGRELYGDQTAIEGLSTVDVLGRMTEAIGDLHNLDDIADITTTNVVDYEIKKNNYKYRMSRYAEPYSYGDYLGDIYYSGTNTDDVIATIKVDNILDYVDNDMVFSQMDNNGKWEASLGEKELILEGYLNPNVATYIDTTRPEDDQIVNYGDSEYEYFKDEDGNRYGLRSTVSGIEIEGAILDINFVGYQTITNDGTEDIEIKNNLAITVDSSDLNGTLSKHTYPDGSGDSEATTELMVSKYLSSENESDEMVYENIAEIIKFTTLTGRRTVSTQTVGNAKMRMAGYVDGDPEGTLGEPDTSITEKVMLTPPTGGEMIDSYGITKVIIYVTASIGAIVLGILFMPKLVTKIKNRKFVK